MAPFAAAWAPMAHTGPARELVVALKFRGALRVAEAMAAPMAAQAPPGFFAGATFVPVPLHPARRRARGFNQAAELAAALGRRTGRPVKGCLRRSGPAARQVGATRARRLEGGRLEVRAARAVPECAVLVDDVHTTGATLAACAAALHAGGSTHVACITYARALR